MKLDREACAATLAKAQERLLAELNDEGFFEGHLSSSALSTAVASFALRLAGEAEGSQRGIDWLKAHVNNDGGWGDTIDSPSNLATTLLAWSALSAGGEEDATFEASAWVEKHAGGLEPGQVARAVLSFYGKDRTFSTPILTLCALAGTLGDSPWRHVPQLPFEAAIIPHSFFRWARLPVVSYALPALIAIGLAKHCHAPTRVAPLRALRTACKRHVLGKLRAIQPASGGFLEAAPLTAFVAMSLTGAGLTSHPATQACIAFLVSEQRDDGSWPIDTNLATWLTSLATRSLSQTDALSHEQSKQVSEYLLKTQNKQVHPYTKAAPGGWAWTHLSGGVPDVDDTAGALIALKVCGTAYCHAISEGLAWLLYLQNRDGGWPTFCRGWGKLPFDRSCADITAHALRACVEWHDEVDPHLRQRMAKAVLRGLDYLERAQRPDGSWTPLWFGNQHEPNHENPSYGTARVVEALSILHEHGYADAAPILAKGQAWLRGAANDDGGWGSGPGTPSSIEETALALRALAATPDDVCVINGAKWLVEATRAGTAFPPAPIGLYFASLWYGEKLYPLIFTVDALAALTKQDG